jgi:hypothetical protein
MTKKIISFWQTFYNSLKKFMGLEENKNTSREKRGEGSLLSTHYQDSQERKLTATEKEEIQIQENNILAQKFREISSFSESKPERNIRSLTIETTNLDPLYKFRSSKVKKKAINPNSEITEASSSQKNNKNLKGKSSKNESFSQQKKQSLHQKQNAKQSTKSDLFYPVIVLLVVSILFLIISFHLEKNKKLQKKSVSRIVNV